METPKGSLFCRYSTCLNILLNNKINVYSNQKNKSKNNNSFIFSSLPLNELLKLMANNI